MFESISNQRYQLIIGILIAKFLFNFSIQIDLLSLRHGLLSPYMSSAINLGLLIFLTYLLMDYFQVKLMYNVKTFYLTQTIIYTIIVLYGHAATGIDSSVTLVMLGIIGLASLVTNLILYGVMAFSSETKATPYLKYFGIGALIITGLQQVHYYLFYLGNISTFLNYGWYILEILFIVHFYREMKGIDENVFDEFVLDD